MEYPALFWNMEDVFCRSLISQPAIMFYGKKQIFNLKLPACTS